jgi:hypothetical protein
MGFGLFWPNQIGHYSLFYKAPIQDSTPSSWPKFSSYQLPSLATNSQLPPPPSVDHHQPPNYGQLSSNLKNKKKKNPFLFPKLKQLDFGGDI